MKTITIEEIESNPNLDLSERISMYSKDSKWSEEDLKELATASIKQEYEYWINNRTNVSERTDAMLKSILNGHILNNVEGFEMMCSDPKKIEQYSKYDALKQKAYNEGITSEELSEICDMIGFDQNISDSIKNEFEERGLINNSNTR